MSTRDKYCLPINPHSETFQFRCLPFSVHVGGSRRERYLAFLTVTLTEFTGPFLSQNFSSCHLEETENLWLPEKLKNFRVQQKLAKMHRFD